MKNPNEQLEQLRRSSLVEFEHLKKDEHPNPPLRALPEHSVFEEEKTAPAPAIGQIKEQPSGAQEAGESSAQVFSSGSSIIEHIGRVSKGASTDDQLKGQQTAIREIVGDSPFEQPPAPLTQTPEAHGIVGKDFASEMQTEHKSQGAFTSEGLFTDPSSQNSSTEDSSEFSTTTTQTSFAQQQSSFTKETVQAGKTTFSLPDFAAGGSNEKKVTGEDIFSPTHTKDEGDTKGQGLF